MENQNTEYKASWRDEYLKWLCGFANAEGGRLLVGVDDNGEVVGVDDAKRLMEDIPNKARDVLGIIVDARLHSEKGNDYVEIIVEPSSYPINCRGEYHIRSGATKQLLQGNALTQFLMRRTGLRWDAQPTDFFTADDLENDSFKLFRKEAARSGRMTDDDLRVPNAELLDKLGLTVGGRLKRAAVLLFHDEPERMLTGCYTKIGLFNDEADILYMDEVHGSLLKQASTVVDLLFLKYLKAKITYENVTRVERYPYPKLAVREAVFNALVHCNWAASVPVQIRVGSDSLVISNDCLLHEGWDAARLLGRHRSNPLNPDIANTFFRAGYIEAWGRGIEKMCRLCREHGCPEPEYEVLPEEMTIRFKKGKGKGKGKGKNVGDNVGDVTNNVTNVTDNVTDAIVVDDDVRNTKRRREICRLLQTDPRMSARQLADALSVTKRTVLRDLVALQDSGIVRREGLPRTGRWVVLVTM